MELTRTHRIPHKRKLFRLITMKKSNSKKLYRFVHSHKSKDTHSSLDSIDSLNKSPSKPLLSTASTNFLPVFPSPLPDKAAHYRSQTYPDPTSSQERPVQVIKKHKHTSSQSSLGNETVIIRQSSESFPEPAPLRAIQTKWPRWKGQDLQGSLARMKVSHQIRCYELLESTAKVRREKQNLVIKEKILSSLMEEGRSQQIMFG